MGVGTRKSLDGRRSRSLVVPSILALVVLCPVVLCPGPAQAGSPVDGAVQGAVQAAVEGADVLRHMKALGADAMEGRGTGTPGIEAAAAYIETRLAEIGLEPMGIDGSFRQPVPLHGSTPLPESRLRLEGPPGTPRRLELWEDYVLFRSGNETFVPRPLPLEFVGYGIIAPELDYNDYLRRDVEGKIAVVLAGEPPSDDPAFFDGTSRTIYSDPEMKFRIALSRGAKGCFLLPSPREGAHVDWEQTRRAFEPEDVVLPYRITGSLNVLLRLERAPVLFARARRSFDDVLELDRKGTLEGFPLRVEASFSGTFRERDFLGANLVARLPGSDPLLRDEYVIVSAHYDGLGVGPALDGDTIYNGVVDNASGTAAVLEIARALAESPDRPRRSILFVFLTGEEKGLLGSRYYGDHPVVPLHRTVAAINVDGLSVLDTTESFVGIGSKYSTLGDLLGRVLAERGLRREEVPPAFEELRPFYDSDQIAFAQVGIPSILVLEGFSYRHLGTEKGLRRFLEWGRSRYHLPSDDLRQPLDADAIEQHVRVLLAYVREVGNTFTEPQWLPGSPFTAARLRSLAEGR
jgi:hypothetical protein